MITRGDIEKLQSDVTYKASIVGQTNNDRTRKDFDLAVEKLIEAEKAYNNQRKTKEIKYTISVRPIGSYTSTITVWEDATIDEIKKNVLDDCEYYLSIGQ